MKKLIAILALCLVCTLSAIGFVACGGGETPEKAHEHTYISSYIDPTCEEQGGIKYFCTCGKEYWEDVVPAFGHNPSAEWTVDRQTTCVEKGLKSHHCITCDKHLDETEIPLLPHQVEDGVCALCHRSFSAEGLTYALNNTETEYSVTGIGAFSGTELYVPQTYNNLPVTGIAAYAFNQQIQLKSVNIPKSIKSIGDYAFNGCVNITRIEFDSDSCQDFEENNNVFAYVGQSQNGTTVAIGKNVVKIPAYFLYSSTKANVAPKIKEINFDNAISIKKINEYAFAGCTALKSLKISDNVNTIEYGAFYGCSYLHDITLPFIGQLKQYSEYDAAMYRSLAYTFSPLEFNGYTFVGGYGTEYVPSSLKTVVITFSEPSASAFSGCSHMENVVIKNAEKINDSLFYGCSSLKTVKIPDTVEEIGASAFYGCSNIETFNFPQELKIIKGSAFAKCTRLAELNFNDKLEEIEGAAFERCVAIKEIVLPSSLNKIGAETFKGCLYVEKITLEFTGTNKTADSGVFGAIFSSSNLEYDYSKPEDQQPEFHTYKITQRLSEDNSSDFWIPKTLKTVIYNGEKLNYGAFSGLTELTEITLGSRVKTIGSYAFSGCGGLSSITIPNNVITINRNAFNGCTGLKTIIVDENNANYSSSEGILYNKSKTQIIYVPLNITGGITIPESITIIQDDAFENRVSLTSVRITENVKSIGKNAFNGCTALDSVKFDNANCWEYGPSFAQNRVGKIAVEDFENIAKIAAFLTDTYRGYVWYRAVYVNIDKNNNSAGSIAQSARKVDIGTTITITATTNNGYTWLGWYDGDNLITTQLSCTFTMAEQDVRYTAKWSKVTLSVNNSSAGSVSVLNGKYVSGDQATVTATTNNGYTWVGWYDGETLLTNELSYTFTMPSENVIYTAKWIKVSIILSDSSVGSVSGLNGKYVSGDQTTITAATNDGYTWIGWYDGETLLTHELSYTFTMPSENATYTAKWTYYTMITDKNISDAGTANYNTATKITAGQSVTATATTNNGYTWIGWYDGETLLTDELGYTFTMPSENVTYTAKWIKVSIILSDSSAGSVAGLNGKYVSGDQATVTATTNFGYTWIGWYDGATLLTDELSYTFTMPSENMVYTARWSKITLAVSDSAAGSVTNLNGKYKFGDEITITATTNNSYYTWIGWYAGERLLTDELSYTFTMPNRSEMYTAKWKVRAELSNYNFTATTNTCTITGIKDKTVTEIIVPDYVTAINQGAFSGCSSLTSITLPFVGGSKSATTASSSTLFGYIFGTGSYPGGIETRQYYSSSRYATYYIPSTLKNVTVTGGNILYGAFYRCNNLTSITIPDSITSIGNSAFYNCSGLTSITIPDSVTRISDAAFSGCSSLTSITIPFVGSSRKTAIDGYQYPFGYIFGTSSYTGGTSTTQYYCGSSTGSTTNTTYYIPSTLKSVTVTGGNILYGAFYNCSSLTSITIPDSVTSIGNYAFTGCSSLKSITIPDSVTSIGSYAFYNCSSLTSVTIPDSVTSIGDYAFYGCSSKILWGDNPSIATVGSYTFQGYKGTSIIIPDSVTSISDAAFSGCSSLTSITIPFVGSSKSATVASSSTLFGYIFGTSSYTGGISTKQYYSSGSSSTYYIPSTLKSVTVTGGNILYGAFYNCSSLTSITIPDSVTSIGDYAFYSCSNLTSITIPDSVTSIGNYAFRACSGLTSITIPDSVTSIGNYAFRACSGLTSITIPDSVKIIEDYAFYGCSKLTSIIIPDSVKIIEDCAFYGCSSLTSVTIGDSVTSIGDYAFSGCSKLTSITIPNSVTSISDAAFSGCSSLTSITIPFVGGSKSATVASSSTLFGYIFGTSSYTGGISTKQYYSSGSSSTYYIPSTLKSVTVTGGNILYGAFWDCSGLTSITIPDSVTSIGKNAFSGCSKLTSITIPDSVTSIGSYAFEDCSSLTSITIPDSVTRIENNAFYNCSSLTSVTFKNTSGWKVYASSTATSGTSVTVTNASTAATYLRSNYVSKNWKRG